MRSVRAPASSSRGRSVDLEHMTFALALTARRFLRPAFAASLLPGGNISQHFAKPLVLDNRRLIDLLQLVECPVRQIPAVMRIAMRPSG